ncbi:flavodoxin [Chryseobacterium ginsenosidimutans]|uniref:flavodoxin family protein n=1 Tax=Chryseobacterium ginsenosidimutans TaxID=687846 RepID=UPI002167C057|nr:flavodoxin [Chryseobacterium ginsenosidimutans]MCS3869237.1 flavodoxin [Chryseobacterium ginsenosidimutans]
MQKFVLIILSIMCFFSCSKAQETVSEKNEVSKGKKMLIVYLSRTKNTKTVAEIIQKNIGGDLVELILENPYPENYKAIVEQVTNENETGFLPPLKTKIENIEKYDVVFIGFPTWGMKLPPPIKSFLKQYNLKGKTVIPFNTNAGYGIGSSFDTVEELSLESKILEGFTIKGGIERDGILFVMEGKKKIEVEKKVKEWLTKIGMSK